MTNSTKYIGMDVHKESISIAVRNAAGKIVMECVIETKASMIGPCFTPSCRVARENQRTRSAPASRILLPTTGCLEVVAPGSA